MRSGANTQSSVASSDRVVSVTPKSRRRRAGNYALLNCSVEQTVSQSCAVAKSENFWRATGQSNLANRMAPLAKVQLCEYENQTLEAFAVASHLSAKFDCPVAHQNH